MEKTYNNTHGATFVNLNKFVYTWTVINFRDTIKKMTSSKIESPWFEIDGIKKELRLDLSINPDLQLGFHHKVLHHQESMRYIVSLIDKNGHERFTRSSLSMQSTGDHDLTQPIFYKFLERKFLNKSNDFLPNGNLTIRCTIYYNENIINMVKPMKIFDEEKYLIQQEESDYFENLFKTRKFSDVQLIIEDKIFNAHKNILAMRSAVFSAMFEHKMKEQKENVVEITDIKYDVMQEVLRYIYTKKIENFSTLGKDILIAADKYAIDGLKYLCEQKFISELSIEKIPEMLILIDSYNLNKLKKFLSEFLRIAATDITQELFEKSSISCSALLKIVEASLLKQ